MGWGRRKAAVAPGAGNARLRPRIKPLLISLGQPAGVDVVSTMAPFRLMPQQHRKGRRGMRKRQSNKSGRAPAGVMSDGPPLWVMGVAALITVGFLVLFMAA